MSTGHELLNQIETKFPGAVKVDSVTERVAFLSVCDEQLVALADFLANQMNARFVMEIGTDKRPVNQKYELSYIFCLDQEGFEISLKVMVDENKLEVPSITPVIPGAGWAEREVYDMLGIVAVNHPDPRRLVLADDWPEDLFPMRKDFEHDNRPPAAEVKKIMKEPDGNATVVSVGPFFPTLEEPAYFRLFVEGEKVVGCDYRGFFSHRGIEKLADKVLDYNQVPFMAERICGICGFVHSCSYCQAVEMAAEIEVPARARYIRTIMLELERIHSHLLWIGLAGHIIGFDTVLMQSWRVREPVMWLCEQITGNRKTYGMNLVGGVRRDIPEDLHPKILETLDKIESESRTIIDAIIKDKPLLMRLQGVGTLSREDGRKLCVVGPTARASGLETDIRVKYPYAAYGELDMKAAFQTGGDVLARTLVRAEELFTAIDLVRQALQKMPEGPIMAEFSDIPPYREGISLIEAPRGESLHYVLTGPDNRPYRWSVRAPTYAQLQAIPDMLSRSTVADFPLIVASIDPCFSCTERVETVDRSSHTIKTYRREELLQQLQNKYRGGERS
ncbi:MAG: hydrogenase-4 subunit [Firmicutes bacterium]|nr:hydrogenase-4 subunit [Bacillota bacterium]